MEADLYEEASIESQLSRQFSHLTTSPLVTSQPSVICATRPDDIVLTIDDLRISSPQLFVSQSDLDDVVVTCCITNRSWINSSPPGCHLRWTRGAGLSLGPERHLLPQLPRGGSVACELRLRAPDTAPTGWHRLQLQLYSPLGAQLQGDAAARLFDVYVAAPAPPASTRGAGESPQCGTRGYDDDIAMMSW